MKWQQLEASLKYIEETFGSAWLKDGVEGIKELDREKVLTGRYIDLWNEKVSPLVLMWYKGSEHLAFYYLDDQCVPSYEDLVLIKLVEDINTVERCSGFEKRKKSLKDIYDYNLTAFSIHIAAGYVKRLDSVHFADDLRLLELPEKEIMIACYRLDAVNDSGDIAKKIKKLNCILSRKRYDNIIHYIDCVLEPGEKIQNGLKLRAKLLYEHFNSFNDVCIVFSTTVLGKNTNGFYLIKDSIARGLCNYKNIYLPQEKLT